MKPEIIERIRQLENDAGEVTPSQVLDDARDPESPLHSCFEWDDSKAAEAYRIDQARTLIRGVRLQIIDTKIPLSAVAYVRDPDAAGREQGYISTAALRTDKDKARRALLRELASAEAAMDRARDFARSVGLSKEVDSLLSQLRGIRTAA